MINVSRRLKVNSPEEGDGVILTRAQVWQGLVNKARNAVPYVVAITECTVIEDKGAVFIREVLLNGERLQELVTLTEKSRVEFVRLSGQARGIIKNIIEEEGGELYLRFMFDFSLEGIEPGSDAESMFSENMEVSYLSAVHSTLRAIRQEIYQAA